MSTLQIQQADPLRHRTKTQALTSYLTQLAQQLGAGERLPTINEMSSSLGVSVVTLNRALSELEAQNIIVRRHGVGIFVSPRIGQRTVGLVYDRDIFAAGASPFCGLLVEAARQRAQTKNEAFSVYLAMPSREGLPVHDDLLEDLHARRLNGLLFVGENNPVAAQWLAQQSTPLVALSYTPIAPYRVCIDWPASVRLGVAALAREGCRKIGLWIPLGAGLGAAAHTEKNGGFPELTAFRGALKTHRLAFDEALVWRSEELQLGAPSHQLGTNQEQGFRAAGEVFGDKARRAQAPDGLLILDDMMARGAIVALQQLGVRPGREISLACHANKGSAVLAPFAAGITRLEVDPQIMAGALFELLETLMNQQQPASPVVAIKPQAVG